MLLTIISFFISFFLLRILHGILAKDLFWKYITLDAIAYGVIFGVSQTLGVAYSQEMLVFANILLFGFFVIPFLYSALKKRLLSKHPKLSNIWYPVIEFGVVLTGFFIGLVINEGLSLNIPNIL